MVVQAQEGEGKISLSIIDFGAKSKSALRT